MALLGEVAGVLSAAAVASSSGVSPGWYLYAGMLPDTPDRVVALVAPTGSAPPIPNVGVEERRFQMFVRGAPIVAVSSAYAEARLKMADVMNTLHFLVGQTLSSVAYPGIVADGEATYMGEDANQRPVWVCNFSAWRQP